MKRHQLCPLVLGMLAACDGPLPRVARSPRLAAHSREFQRSIIRVTDGVWVAVGYGLANAILLEGPSGVVIVDTLESAEAARPVVRAFRRLVRKPVRAILYTHNHADHVFGAGVFAGIDRPRIISHATTRQALDRILSVIRPAIYRRSMRQFGTLLPSGWHINAGIGPRLRFSNRHTAALLRPTHTFNGRRTEMRLAGLRLVLQHAPGETDDQIFVWLPDRKVLLCGDNFYRSFPNLYAIRGTAYRDPLKWVASLDAMRALRPRFLVPSHGRPLRGTERIHQTLTHYRDAIQLVHDQTVRGLNQGLTEDALVRRVRLPPHLARLPYLQEYYGKVAWAVRAIRTGYLGWFGGNATELHPLSARARAARLAHLVGGPVALLRHARMALSRKEFQWALELADHLLRLHRSGRVYRGARRIRAAALMALGQAQHNANARSYYLTQALEAAGRMRIRKARIKLPQLVRRVPLGAVFRAMTVSLDPVRSARVDVIIGFHFPDVRQSWTLHVRRGVAEIQPRAPERPHIQVTVDSILFKEIAARIRSATWAVMRGRLKVRGGLARFARVMGMFKPD